MPIKVSHSIHDGHVSLTPGIGGIFNIESYFGISSLLGHHLFIENQINKEEKNMKKSCLAKVWPVFCIFLLLSLVVQPGIGLAKTQNIPLSPGWNLISLQLEPDNTDPAAVLGSLISNGRFQAIWAYDPVTGTWSTYQHQSNNLLNTFTGVALTAIHAYKGYWIQVTDYTEVEVSGQISSSPIDLGTGWNLVGFSGYFLQDIDEQDIDSVFSNEISKIDEVWKFESGSGKFLVYDLNNELKRDFVKLEPGKGYWVKAKESFTLAPKLGLNLEGDIDVPPLSTIDRPFPQSEDDDLNGDGYYNTPEFGAPDGHGQDTISFRTALTTSYLTITNRGEGTLNWEAREDIPWLFLDQNCGITTTETDSICATVNRDGLTPGLYTGTLDLIAQGQQNTVLVKMIVPEIDGDYEGRAVVNYVNGNPADIASVDLSLSLFRDQEGFLRGIVDADKTLLSDF